MNFFFFFFSSRRRHTRLTCDWSSDVCSSDLTPTAERDIEAVSGYIAQDSPENASAFIIALDRNISNFVETHCNASLPLRCPFIPENEILGTSYRHLLYGNYRTIF